LGAKRGEVKQGPPNRNKKGKRQKVGGIISSLQVAGEFGVGPGWGNSLQSGRGGVGHLPRGQREVRWEVGEKKIGTLKKGHAHKGGSEGNQNKWKSLGGGINV